MTTDTQPKERGTWRPGESIEDRLAETEFLVEATSFEEHCLWSRHAVENRKDGVEWQQIQPGYGATIGTFGRKPIFVTFTWSLLDGVLVCFYEPTSEVVDHATVNRWLGARFTATYDNGSRKARCDSWNFHHCLTAVKEKRGER